MSAFLRQCFLSWSDGSPCEYTAPSKRAFKRHLETKHQVKLSVRGRGPSAREVFTPLTATERALSRINVSNRQGGRGPDRARLREELGFPAPPRPCSNPPTERVGELLSSRAPQGYLPEGYRSPASDLTSSSLSLGGLTNDVDADLDEIDLSGAMELAGPSDTWMASLPDLATVATVGLDANMQRSPTPSAMPTNRTMQDVPAQPTTATIQPPKTKTFTATATQVAPTTADAATAARPLPAPLLSAPSISTIELARRVEQSFHSHPLAPTDAILDDVRRSFVEIVPASEIRSTNLAIDFGAELLRLTADRLLRELQARFMDISQLDHNMTAATLRYIFEELDIWRRRPERSPSSVSHNLL